MLPRITPVAQKMAAEMGIDLRMVTGSGEHDRITKEDVARAVSPAQPGEAIAEPTPQVAPQAPTAPPPAAPHPEADILERVSLKGIRGIIARRMAESVHTTARVTLVTEVDATEFVALREKLKAKFSEAWGFTPGYNDLLGLIVANALRKFSFMNARLSAEGDAIEHLGAINMGMAVDTERGLMVTVIRNADTKGLQQFGTEFRAMVDRARTGKSTPDDLSGGTFTITNLGMYRVDAFTPIINLPEAAILGVGRITPKPVVKGEEIVIRKTMTLSLVFDHRLTDGAPAARFLDYICELIEEPYLLFLTTR
jgi:pyruvate dehydrogenase E2 component (dihydrolipoamide acetyltransferase)